MNALKLLERFGSPLYVYDATILRDRCQNMKKFQDELNSELGIKVSMHYSTKANNNPAILKEVKDSGLNVDCMSPLELTLNEKCGFEKDRMLYVCNNISSDEMKEVHDKNILICLDSISQVETWGKMFPNTDIMVRINPGIIGVGHSEKVVTSGKATKFGISEENLPTLFEVANKYGLCIIGTHQHLGSLFLNDKISNYIAGVKAGLNIVKTHFKDVQIVDLGGGFGVPYEPEEEELNFSLLTNKLLPVLKEFISEYPYVKEFKFEPGRYIPCEAGILLSKVTAVKYENDTHWVCCDAGMNQIARPSMYGSYHEIKLQYKNEPSKQKVYANFCGNVCESGDILGKKRLIALPKVEDAILIYNAGAYGFSMASNYTGRLRPAEVMLFENDETKLIRRRENLEELMENIVW